MTDTRPLEPLSRAEPIANQKSVKSFDEAVEHVDRLATELQAAIKRAKKNMASGTASAESVLRELGTAIDAIATALPELQSLASELESDARTEFLRLEADLREAVQQRGWRVDGQWPVLHVERGVTIEIDEKKRTAKVAGKAVARPTATVIVRTLERLVPTLRPKQFDAAAFVESLAAAYDAVAGRGVRQASVFEVYREFVVRAQPAKFWRDTGSVTFTPIGIDQFRAQLSTALESGVRTTRDGRELRLVPPLQPKDGIFLYQPAENRFGFVGRLEFVANEVER